MAMPTPERIVATLHRPIVRLRVAPSRAIVALPIRRRLTRLRAHRVRRRVIAAIRQIRRQPTAALRRRDRTVREEATADLVEAAVIPAAAAEAVVILAAAVAAVAIVPEAVRPGDVQGVPRA